jgi:hypothetical protein
MLITVKQLKAILENLPEDAEVRFQDKRGFVYYIDNVEFTSAYDLGDPRIYLIEKSF